MKDIFKYTFLFVSDIKKFLAIVLIMSILTLIEPFPFIGYTSLIFEKLLYLSLGAFLIYILKHSQDSNQFLLNLQKNSLLTMLMHFFPTAAGIMLGSILIIGFWLIFFLTILQTTNSLFILANPHNFIISLSQTSLIAKILIGLYSLYLLLFSYIFLGKLGEALNRDSFKGAFISTILSLVDFKYWIKTFNLKYFLIYNIWAFITLIIYSLMSFTYIFVIFPTIINNPNLSLLVIPLLNGATAIVTVFTFFSAYFANKTTRN